MLIHLSSYPSRFTQFPSRFSHSVVFAHSPTGYLFLGRLPKGACASGLVVLGGAWVVLGWCSGGARVVLGWCSGGAWVVLGWCLAVVMQ
jgi:hypothetical protein